MDRGGDHLVRCKLLHQQAHRRHVCHSVHGAHLVEMDVRHRHAMDMALRLGNAVIYRQNVPPHPVGHREPLHNVADLVHTVVVMVGVLMVVVVLMVVDVLMVVVVMMVVVMLRFPVHRHGDSGAGDAALFGLLQAVCYPGNTQAVETLDKFVGLGQQLQQRRRQHISGGAHAAVQIQGPHFFPSM